MQTKSPSSPKLDARADMVSLHSTGPRMLPTQRSVWVCSDVASERTVEGMAARSASASAEMAISVPTIWPISVSGMPTSAETVRTTSKGRDSRFQISSSGSDRSPPPTSAPERSTRVTAT